jgi:DNA uptake protein ComE-like DNA-binding protein
MSRYIKTFGTAAAAAGCALLLTAGAHGQVGKSLGVVDANLVSEADLLKMPHMTAAVVKGLIAGRNYASIVDLNKYLLGAGLTQEQAMEFYTRAFIHVNLNTATREEILLVPGAGRRMTIEFPEYRPWKTFAQFDKEIGKYVGQEATDQLRACVHPGEPEYGGRRRHPHHPGAGAHGPQSGEYRPDVEGSSTRKSANTSVRKRPSVLAIRHYSVARSTSSVRSYPPQAGAARRSRSWRQRPEAVRGPHLE